MIHPIHLISLVNVICPIHHSQYCPVIHQSGQTKVLTPDEHLELHTFNSIEVPGIIPVGCFTSFVECNTGSKNPFEDTDKSVETQIWLLCASKKGVVPTQPNPHLLSTNQIFQTSFKRNQTDDKLLRDLNENI